MGLFDTKLDKKIEAINRSGLSEEEKNKLLIEIISEKPKPEKALDDNTVYFKKYYIKVSFVVFVFTLIATLAYYSLSQMFQSDTVNKEAVAITNLILGTLLGKASDLFELIRNGNKKSDN